MNTSFASTAVVGAVVASNMRRERENRERRIRNERNDQILIKSKLSKDKINSKLAYLLDLYIKDNELYISNGGFDMWEFFGILILSSVPSFFIWFMLEGGVISFITILTILLIFSFLMGIDFKNKIDYIEITKEKDMNYILIKVYDDDGRRNLSEIEIDKIRESFGGYK